MVQQVEAWGNLLEFPDDMSHEEMSAIIRRNEVHLNPNASTLTKASAAVSKGIDAGLSMLTPKKSIADQAQERSASLADIAAPQVSGVPIRRDYYNNTVAEIPAGSSVPDTGIVSRVRNIAANDKQAQAGKRTVAKALVSAEPDEGIGLLGTLKEGAIGTARNIGAAIDTARGNAGNVISASQDAANAEKDPALESLLNDINARKKALGENPGWLDSIKAVGGAALKNPKGAGLLVAEQLPNSATALGAGAAGMAAGSLLGPAGAIAGGIAGLFGANTALETGGKAIEAAADGTFSPAEQSRVLKEGATKGAVVTGVDAATLGLTNFIMGTTARAVERATVKTLADHGVDVTNKAAVLAATKNPAIVAAVQSSQELAQAASNTLGKKIARVGGATGLETVGEGAGDYLGEMAATGKADKVDAVIEALSSLGQSAGEIAFTAARNKARLATIAGKPVDQLPDSALKYTAARGGERAKAAAKAELDRRASQGETNNTPESTPETVDRIIATGREKADETRAATPDALKSDVLDEENTPETSPEAPQQTQPEGTSKPSSILPEAPAEPSGDTVTFKTAKGSTYKVVGNSTIRDKAARPEHPGEFGIQPKSDVTIYVTKDQLNLLGEEQAKGGPRAVVKPLGDGRYGVQYLEGKDKGKFEKRTVITPQTEPAVGLHPVEIIAGKTTHFGNEITEVNRPNIAKGKANAHIVLPDNTSLPAQWDVVDADSVKASLKEGVNQPRDRSRAASDIQVQGIANNPDYRRLSDSPVMDVGAPTLSHDGLIVGGNGRFEGINRAYDQGSAAAYLAQLKVDAAAKGIDPAKIDTMKKPVLVRRITQPFDTRKLAEASNSGTGMQYSGLELAKIDAGRMKNLHDLEVTDTGDIALTGANIQNVRHALSGYNAAELGALVDKNGHLSQEGVKRIRNALLYSAYGNNATLERIVESTDNDLRNISGALVKAAGTVARVRADIKAGAIPAELDISHDLVSSVEELSKIRAMGMTGEQYFAQLGMFGGGLSEEQKHILLTLEANIRSQKKLADFIKGYYESISNIDLSSGDMFGTSTPTKPELLKNAKEQITDKQLPESKPDAKPDSKPADESRKQPGNNESSDASRKQDKPDFGLKKHSEAELKAAAEKQAAEKKKAEAEKKRLDDAEKKKREQKEIDQRQKSSADNFELGKSAVDSLAGQGDIFSQPVQKAPPLDYDKIQKRPDTNERQLKAGQSAYEERLRNIVNRANGSLLGAALAKDFRERGGSELIGKTVKTPQDLAVLAQIFRDPRFETFRIFFTKQGNIVHHTGITSRLPGSVAVVVGKNGESQVEANNRLFSDLARQKKASGADGYYLLHNHPSGRATPSTADKQLTKAMAGALPGFKFHVVIDTNEYGTITKTGLAKVIKKELTGGYSDTASVPHDALRKKATSPSQIAEIGKLVERKQGFFSVIGLSAQLDVVAIADVPLSIISSKNNLRLHAMLRMFARNSGSNSIAVVADDISPFKKAITSGVIIDAVSTKGGKSARELYSHPSSSRLFNSSIPKSIQVEEANNQTDTPAFKKWFGNSKVVDKAGKPLVVYHGTVHDVDKFDTSRLGETTKADSASNGFFFTSDTEIANGYSDVFAGRTYREIARRRAEAEKKAMLTNDPSDWDAYNDLSAQLSKQDKIDRQARTAEGANVLPVFLSIQNPVVVDFAGRDYNENEYMQAIDQAKTNGNDGVIFHNAIDDPVNYERSADIYVVFKPEQIKSAIGNNGDFDSANPLIVNQTPSGYLFQTFNAPEKSRLDDLIHALQDKHIDLKRVTEAIKATGKQITDNINAYLQEELFHGRTATRVKEFIDKELDPLIKLMRVNGVKMADFEEYLWARHAEERNIQINKINPDPDLHDKGSGMSTKDARDYLKNLDPDKRKLYEALAKRVDAINKRSRQVLVDYGLESQKTINTWESAYQHYVPLMREDMDHAFGNGTGQGFSVKGNASKRATGSKRPVVDILANIAQQREKNIIRGEKNRVATALVGLAKTNPNPDFWKVDTPPTIRTVNKTTGLVETRTDPTYKSRDDVVVARIPDKNGNIQERSVVFQDDPRAKRMALSLKNLDVDQLGAVLNASSAVTRYFSSINTQYNPIFGIVNLTRDVQGAMLNLTSTPLAGKKAAVLSHTGPALLGIYQHMRGDRKGKAVTNKWSQLWEEFQKEGGKTGFRDMYANAKERANALEKGLDPDWWQKTKIGKTITAGGLLNAPEKLIADKAVKPLFDWLSDYNDSMENAVRLAAYKTGLEQGLSKQQAASVAKNLTVNFNRKGAAGRQIGALYAFFNASVQGTARLAETVKGPAGKRIVAGGILLGGMQAMLLAIAGMGDDEPPEFVKSKSLILPIGDGKYLSVPMPLGFNVLPNLGRITADFVMSGFKDPGKRTVQMMDSIMDAFNPIGNAGMSLQTITPTIVDPFAALAENKDWTGKPIAREDFNSMNPTPGFTRAKDSASAFSKLLSEGLNQLSGGTKYQPGKFSPTPDQIDYLISQATGGVGREYLKAEQTVTAKLTGEDLPPHKVPLLGRFYGDTKGQGSQEAPFYENIKRLNGLEAEIKGRMKNREDAEEFKSKHPEWKLIGAANTTEKMVQELRKRSRDLDKTDKPDKAELKKQFLERRREIMTRFNNRFKEATAN